MLSSCSGRWVREHVTFQYVDPSVSQPVWVTIPILTDAEPGTYTGKVTIRGRSGGKRVKRSELFTIRVYKPVVEKTSLWVTNEGKPYRQQNNDLCYVLPRWSDEQFKDYIRRYWGYCGYIDQQIGTIFVALQETGQWDNTIIVFTSDHGDMVGAHGMIWKLCTCGYEELFRVPAIIKVPEILDKNRFSNALAGNIDLLPTILEAAGIKLPGDIDGRSLMPILKGTANRHRDIVFADAMDESIGQKKQDIHIQN